jgi:hypothetical protein
MSVRKPAKKDIIPGNIVDILDGEGNKKGKARLIRRNPSKYKQDNLPYIRQESIPDSDDHDAQDDTQGRVWSFERWVVEWTQHPRLQGQTDSQEVHYFVKAATHTSSVYDPMSIRTVGSSFRVVFIDIPDVLEMDGEFCETCVDSLNKLWKSFKKPDVVLYYHNQLRAKEQLQLLGFKGKIGGFIDPKEIDMEQGVQDYLDINDCDDYLVLTNQQLGFDPERTIVTSGLTWKK